ncbi:hypothetical protein LR69_03544 [Geobacillus sp. BCO2]|nr:hypothetical protein LR69_03544 [Geobacillus sp. BCO2]
MPPEDGGFLYVRSPRTRPSEAGGMGGAMRFQMGRHDGASQALARSEAHDQTVDLACLCSDEKSGLNPYCAV